MEEVGASAEFFEGQIDFVRIHSRALSEDEIARRAQRLARQCGDD